MSLAYGTILSSVGDLMRSQSLKCGLGTSLFLIKRNDVQILGVRTLREVAREEVEERLHLCIESLRST